MTTYGSAIFVDHVPTETAESVRRLEAAGYANVGKTNLHEFAYGITSENPHFGTVPNPIAPGRIAGGSSGGSAAALAAGLAEAALGTDSGGSIRIPAACCGIVGFKPTFDLVPTNGCFPLAPSFDTVGPMARSVEDCERMLRALVPGFAPMELGELGDIRVGTTWFEEADRLVATRLREASERFPQRVSAELGIVAREIRDKVSDLFQSEVADIHRELYAEHSDLYGAEVATKIEQCLAVTADEVANAGEMRDAYRTQTLERLADIDILLCPTMAFVAPPTGIGDLALRARAIQFTFPFNVLGWPALALPCGPAEDGLPASLQLVGKPGDDALVLAAARLLAASLLRGTPAAA